jgi:hypothetical protein
VWCRRTIDSSVPCDRPTSYITGAVMFDLQSSEQAVTSTRPGQGDPVHSCTSGPTPGWSVSYALMGIIRNTGCAIP